jgi:hypothetical protein
MQSHAIPHARASFNSPALRHRFEPVVHIVSGQPAAILSQGMREYGDEVRFTARGYQPPRTPPGEWLAASLEATLRAASANAITARPLHVPAPSPALLDAAARGACLDALHRMRACAQEIVLEFDDWVLGTERRELVFALSRFRSVGFRLCIDATASWQMPTGDAVPLLIDSVRVDAGALFEDGELAARCRELSMGDIDIIADRPRWRDAGALVEFGAHYASRPQADA